MDFIDPKIWFGEVAMLLGSEGTNINEIFLRIGVLIYFVSFAVGAVSWILNRRSVNIVTYLIRTLAAGALLANLSPLNQALISTWENAYDGAVAVQGTTMQTQLTTIGDQLGSFSSDLISNEAAMSTLTNAYTDLSGALPNIEGDTNGPLAVVTGLFAAKGASSWVSKTPVLGTAFRTLSNRVTQFILPLLSAFSLFTFLTGLSLLVGLTLLPLILGLFPTGLGTGFLVRWCSIILTSLATVIFIPLLSNMLLDFTVVQPVTQLADAMGVAADDLKATVASLPDASGVSTAEFAEQRENWFTRIKNFLQNLIPGTLKRVEGVINGAFNAAGALLVGLVLSIVAVFRLESMISSFLQGAGAGAGAATMAVAALLGRGGGGSKKSSEPGQPQVTSGASAGVPATAAPSLPRGPSPSAPAAPRQMPPALPPPTTKFL
ncbi:hypothetical protein BH24DEI2_BH24DEI2_23000 [soil metagenome]